MRRSNFKDWGYVDYQDIMTGVDVLIERGLADPERMGVMGWSYGGFMTSMIVTKTSRFKAASVGAGVTNPYSFYGLTDIPEFMEAYFGGKPWEAETDYLRHAAEHHAGNAKTPTLIQHGKEDVRVPLAQGEAFYRALKKNGVDVEMVIYPRTPHGLREPKLIRDALERNLEWFNRRCGFWRGFVDEQVRRYLDCGLFENGFARIRCPDCTEEYMLAFSCKTRELCPSCAAKRSAATAALLAEEVFEEVGHAQWVVVGCGRGWSPWSRPRATWPIGTHMCTRSCRAAAGRRMVSGSRSPSSMSTQRSCSTGTR
jgi:dienelactone hydrolase